jgi:hypothetical protein
MGGFTSSRESSPPRPSNDRFVAVRDADHGRAVLKFLFDYGALAPTIGHDALPWRLTLRRDVIEVHAAHAIGEAGDDFDALLVECGGAIAIARLVLARLGFESNVSWGLKEGTHVASVHAATWRSAMVAELPPMFAEAAPASEAAEPPAETRAALLDGWQKLAIACGTSLEAAHNEATPSTALVRSSVQPLSGALRFALEGTRGEDDLAPFPPFTDGFVARIKTNRRGPGGLVALGHAAASVALDARANGYAFASGALERSGDSTTLPIALGRRRALAA